MHPVQSLSGPVRVWLTRVYTLRLNQGKQNWGNTRGGVFPGSGQTKPGAQGKKLASGAKGKCSGKSDWLMAGSFPGGIRPKLDKTGIASGFTMETDGLGRGLIHSGIAPFSLF